MDDIKKLISIFLGDSLTDLLKSGTDRITNEISQIVNNRILEYLAAEYTSNYKTKTLLYTVEPIELEKFYQPLYIRRKDSFIFCTSENSNKSRINTIHLNELFDKNMNCITITGTAGSGKSTLVKYLLVDCIRNKYKIPIKIELRYLNNYNGDLLSYISDEIIKFNRIAEKDMIVEKLLNSGKFVFFLDGYDEIFSNKKEKITKDICKIVKRFNNNKYLLTSRPFVYVEMLDNFSNYEICDLEPDEINSFIRKQFSSSYQESAENIIKTIENNIIKNDGYKSFLKNPLLLSMFIIACDKDSYIPEKKSEYYKNVFEALFSAHDTKAKLHFVREKKSGLSREDILKLLNHFSFKSFFEQKYFFSKEYFEVKMKQKKDELKLDFEIDNLLDDLKVAIGILTEEGTYITYPHRSLQEYFAASYVTSLTHDNKIQFYKILTNHIKNKNLINMDFLNFFSLLKEMDKIDYQRQIEIPLLKFLKVKLTSLSAIFELDFLIWLDFVLYNIDKTMGFRYGLELNKVYNKARKNHFISHDYLEISEKGKQLENIISDFFRLYNFDNIISNIEKDINNTLKNESKFIDFLRN